jgi:hypothetical protein
MEFIIFMMAEEMVDGSARVMIIAQIKNNGSCGIHGRFSHAGENFKFGSVDCNETRKALGLEEV